MWIDRVDLPFSSSLPDFLKSLNQRFPEGWCTRGCSFSLREELKLPEHSYFCLGAHALLFLSQPQTKHVQSLARRGARTLEVREILETATTKRFARELLNHTSYSEKPQLRLLFRSPPGESERSFCAISKGNGQALGLVSLTQFAPDGWHAEVLLRSRQAPQGTMELLLSSVSEQLAKEGAKRLSLGEVPFLEIEASYRSNSKLQKLLSVAAPRLLYPSYNYRGLQRFKAKFHPQWEPLYWIASKRFRTRDVLSIGYQSGCFHLAAKNLRGNSAFRRTRS